MTDRGAGTPAVGGGIVIVDKPLGMTSHDVVSRMRRIAGIRRVGHAGTLDPQASGVLVLGIGPMTRLLGHLTHADKEYLATIRLGRSTSTDDAEGEVLASAGAAGVDPDVLGREVRRLTGPIRQRPSAVSAIKVDGRRAHERVRAGEDVVLPEREVTVHDLEVLAVREGIALDDGTTCCDVDVRVSCSAGTYVRALARDLGAALGTGGHVTALRRTRSGCFTLEDARALDDLAAAAESGQPPAALAPRAAAMRALAWQQVDQDTAERIRSGARMPWPDGTVQPAEGAGEIPPTAPIALVDEVRLLAVARRVGDGIDYAAVFP